MKQGIHPTWYPEAKIVCACGNAFTTGSIVPEIKVEICSNCHPLFTGKAKFVDTLGQIERFEKKAKISEAKKAQLTEIEAKRKAKVAEVKKEKPSLKELLMQARKQAAS